MRLTDKKGIQPEVRRHFTTLVSIAIPLVAAPPDNAVDADGTIAEAVILLLNDGDTVTFDGETYTYDAAAVVADGEFSDAVELAAHIDGARWDGTENAGAVDITANNGGSFWNQYTAVTRHLHDTTTGGGAVTQAEATIEAAAVNALAEGDTILFDGNVFTRAAATSVADNEFLNMAGLIECIDALADWDATLAIADCLIESTLDGAEWNGRDVVVVYNTPMTGGADGTPGVVGAICTDGSRIYLSTETAGLDNDSWERSDDINFGTY